MTISQERVSWLVMFILIFVGENIVTLGDASTGPNLYLDLAFGWLQLHRYGEKWRVVQFDFPMLVVAILSAILVTWIYQKQCDSGRPSQELPPRGEPDRS